MHCPIDVDELLMKYIYVYCKGAKIFLSICRVTKSIVTCKVIVDCLLSFEIDVLIISSSEEVKYEIMKILYA